jgi:trehalose/maltose hydrolase-like predicted phosphorylase
VPLAASINMLLMQFCGIDTSYNAIRIDPHLTKVISRLAFRFSYQHQWYPHPPNQFNSSQHTHAHNTTDRSLHEWTKGFM